MDGIFRRVTWGHSRGLHASAGVECDDAAANVEPAYIRSSGKQVIAKRTHIVKSLALQSPCWWHAKGGKISFLTPRTLNSRVVWPVHLTLRRQWTPSTHSIVHSMTAGYGCYKTCCVLPPVSRPPEVRPPPSLVCRCSCARVPPAGGSQLPGCNLCILYKNPQRKLAPWPLGSRVPAMAICISSPCPCSRLDSRQPAANMFAQVLWHRSTGVNMVISRLRTHIQRIEIGRPSSCCSVGRAPTHHHCDPSANPGFRAPSELTGR